MQWNDHSDLSGKHAVLGASNYHWLNYDDEALRRKYESLYSQTVGTALHALANSLIDKRIRLNKNDRHLVLLKLLESGIPRGLIDLDRFFPTLMQYVNDGIGFRMETEQTLYFTDNCFGTADAISFRDGKLQIHDFKSGMIPAHMEQLLIYAALFCLEYNVKPKDISMELRIYQGNEIQTHCPTEEDILPIIHKMKDFDKKLRKIRSITEG